MGIKLVTFVVIATVANVDVNPDTIKLSPQWPSISTRTN